MSKKNPGALSSMIDDEFDMVLVGMYKADHAASYLKMLYEETKNPAKLKSFIMEDISLGKQFGCDLSILLCKYEELAKEYEHYLDNWSMLEHLLNDDHKSESQS